MVSFPPLHFRELPFRFRPGRGIPHSAVAIASTDPQAPFVSEQIAEVHERCPTRKAAVEAGRRLMAEKVESLSAESYVEASICSALEWRQLE